MLAATNGQDILTAVNTALANAATASANATTANNNATNALNTANNITNGTVSSWNTNWTGGIIFGNNVILRGVNSYFKMEGGWEYQNGAQFVGQVAFNGFQFTGQLGGTLSLTNLTTSGSKSFAIDDPSDGTKTIRYTCVESPKVLVEDAGDAQLSNGQATITLDATFSRVSEGALRATVTPTGDCKGLYVASVAADRSSFVVRECQGGTSNVGFNWRAWATRLGYVDFPVVIAKAA